MNILFLDADDRITDGSVDVLYEFFEQRGGQIPEKIHKEHCTVWTVLSGKAVIRINGRNHDAYAGDTYTIDRGVPHSLRAVENTVLLEVQIEG